MNTSNYRFAAWAGVVAATAFIVEVVVALAAEMPAYAETFSSAAVVLPIAVHVACGAYATYRLRDYLNTRYEFSGADRLILWLVALGLALGLVTIASKLFVEGAEAALLMMATGIPLGLVSVLFGYRLLAVNSSMAGLKKPFAWCHIVAPFCFLSVVLAPLGLLLLIVAQGLLAAILFNNASPELEFV